MTRLRIAWAVNPWGVLARIVLGFAVLGFLVHLGGCIVAWPAICPLVDGERRCRCGTWTERITAHPTKPRPAGVVYYLCDGVALPITVEAEDCGP